MKKKKTLYIYAICMHIYLCILISIHLCNPYMIELLMLRWPEWYLHMPLRVEVSPSKYPERPHLLHLRWVAELSLCVHSNIYQDYHTCTVSLILTRWPEWLVNTYVKCIYLNIYISTTVYILTSYMVIILLTIWTLTFPAKWMYVFSICT